MELTRRGGVEWFGNPLEGGAIITSFAETRPAEIFLQVAVASVAATGEKLTPELLRELEHEAVRRETAYYAEVHARGVSQGIRELLAAKRKKDVERIANEIQIEADDFTDLCINCRILHLSHHSKFQHFEPEQRLLTDAEREQLLASTG